MKPSISNPVKYSVLLTLLLFLPLFFSGCANILLPQESQADLISAQSIDGSLQMTAPGTWEVFEDPAPYDLRLRYRQLTYTGAFVYHLSELSDDITPAQLLDYHVSDLMSRRENAELVKESESVAFTDKTITDIIYTGEHDLNENIYVFSLIEFTGKDMAVVVIQTCIPSEFEQMKDEMAEVVQSAQPL